MLDSNELMTMFGYVDEEDREKWERMEAAKDRRNSTEGESLATKVSQGGMGLAEHAVTSRMRAADKSENDKGQETRTKRETRWSKVDYVEDDEAGGPEF